MGDVIKLSDRIAEREPHLAGTARCVQCEHEWVATAPTGSVWLDCPACGSQKGVFKYPCAAVEGSLQWICTCGCDVFYITPAYVGCCCCGERQELPSDMPVEVHGPGAVGLGWAILLLSTLDFSKRGEP